MLAMVVAIPGCTLVKPVVGAVIGPFVMVGESGGIGDCCGADPRALACAYMLLACVGAAGGLVSGVISDVQVLSGAASADPTANWWDPFKTNTSRGD